MNKRKIIAFGLIPALGASIAGCSGAENAEYADNQATAADTTSIAPNAPVEKAVSVEIETAVTPFTKDSQALLEYLNAGGYKGFPLSDERHPSTGPHDEVRVFYNQTVADSLAAGNTEHPAGSMIVKEQYKAGDEEPYGWSVSIKTHKEGMSGDGWYWVEFLDRNDIANIFPDPPGNGAPACAGCHTLGKDLIRSTVPE